MSQIRQERTYEKAVLEFFVTEQILHVFLIKPTDLQDDVEVFELDITEREIENVLEELNDTYDGLKSLNRSISVRDINGVSLDGFNQLGKRIFTPQLRAALTDIEGVYLIPFSFLHYFPIHAMPFGEQTLIDEKAIAYLPSSSLIPHVNAKREENHFNKELLAIGVDTFDRTNAFIREVRHIANMDWWKGGQMDTVIGEHSIKQNILNKLPKYRAIHFSTHGYFSEYDPLESGLLLYTEEDHFQPAQSEGTDTILSANDLQQFDLSADLMTMSACVTGQNKNHPGDELVGLSRSVLYSGAKSMILSLFVSFKIATINPDTHFGHFYKYWLNDGMSKARAFQMYILSIKSSNTFSHPLFWFPYVYIGELD